MTTQMINYDDLSPSQKRGVDLLAQFPKEVQDIAMPLLMQGPGYSVVPKIYWSMVRFEAALQLSGQYAINQGTQVTAFGYKVGDAVKSAGFNLTVPANFVATRAQTNLTVGGTQTEDNADCVIWGMGMALATGGNDENSVTQDQQPELCKAIMRNTDVIMSLSTQTKFYLGRIAYYPQPGGLDGEAISQIRQGFTNNRQGQIARVMRNGQAGQGNLRKLPSPIRWQSIGSNKKDTSMNVQFTVAEPILLNPAAGGASAVDAAAYPGFVPLADTIFQDLEVWFQLIEVSDRSENQ